MNEKRSFLQRWAYWILGTVVAIGFANALVSKRYPKFVETVYMNPAHAFGALFYTKPPLTPLPKGYARFDINDLTFATPELEKLFKEVYRTAREQSGTTDSPPVSFYELTTIRERTLSFPNYPLEIVLTSAPAKHLEIERINLRSFQHDSTKPGFDKLVFLDFDLYLNKVNLRMDFTAYQTDICRSFGAPNFSISGYVPLEGYEYSYHVSKNTPTEPPLATLSRLHSPEIFLEKAMQDFEELERAAQDLFKDGTLFRPQGTKYSTIPFGLDSQSDYSDLSPEQQQELFQQVLKEVESQRQHLKDHYREMQEQLPEAFPLRETLERVYGPQPNAAVSEEDSQANKAETEKSSSGD